MGRREINWEKISVYIALLIGFLTVIIYISDMKERIAKLEVKTDKFEKQIERTDHLYDMFIDLLK